MNKRDIKTDEALAEQCYVNPSEFDHKKYAALIRADERDACAKQLDALGCDHCAAAIRARGKP